MDTPTPGEMVAYVGYHRRVRPGAGAGTPASCCVCGWAESAYMLPHNPSK